MLYRLPCQQGRFLDWHGSNRLLWACSESFAAESTISFYLCCIFWPPCSELYIANIRSTTLLDRSAPRQCRVVKDAVTLGSVTGSA